MRTRLRVPATKRRVYLRAGPHSERGRRLAINTVSDHRPLWAHLSLRPPRALACGLPSGELRSPAAPAGGLGGDRWMVTVEELTSTDASPGLPVARPDRQPSVSPSSEGERGGWDSEVGQDEWDSVGEQEGWDSGIELDI